MGAKGTDLHAYLFETFSFHPLPGPIFHTAIQITFSFTHILFVYIVYLISFVLYKSLKRIILHFKKGVFTPIAPSNERQERRLLPSVPLISVPDNTNIGLLLKICINLRNSGFLLVANYMYIYSCSRTNGG